MKKENSDLKKIDIARGMAILLVIIGHTITKDTAANNVLLFYVRLIIYTIHMPVFFTISGYLFEMNLKKYLAIGKKIYIKKKFFAFMIPYFSISILNYLIIYIGFKLPQLKEILLSNGFFLTNISNLLKMLFTYIDHFDNHLWFLYTMFLILCANITFFSKNNLKKYVIISLIFYIIGIYSINIMPEIIWKVFKYTFLFMIGRLMFFKNIEKNTDKNISRTNIILCIVSLIVLILSGNKTTIMSNFARLITEVTSSYIIIFIIAKSLSKNKFLENIGKGETSLILYLFHMPFILPFFVYILQNIGINIYLNIIISTTLTIIVCLIIKVIFEKVKIFRKIFLGKN